MYRYLFLCWIILCTGKVFGQPPAGIGTATPDSHAALDISSQQKGVLFPSLTTSQQTTLAGMLGPQEIGMLVTDAATGSLKYWGGSSGWQTFVATNAPTGKAPLTVTANTVRLNPGTATGDLLTWDGNNWVNAQPPIQHFTLTADNRQPYLTMNYVIALFGIFPTQNDATSPYVGEIYLMGCNFAPLGFALCNGQVLSIATNTVLFDLIGTIYGGDGINTFNLPDLQGRVPVHMGNNGTSNYIIGQLGGSEQMKFIH